MSLKKMNKEELIALSKEHQHAIENDFNAMVDDGQRYAKKAAIVAGGLLVSYLVIRLLTRKKVVTNDAAPVENANYAAGVKTGVMGTLSKMVLTEAGVLAMAFAKDKIKNYFENFSSDEHSEEVK